MWIGILFWVVCLTVGLLLCFTLFPEIRAIGCACAGAHVSKFTCEVYHTCEIIVFF